MPGTEELEACEAPWPFSFVELMAELDIVRLTIAESVVVDVVDCLSVLRESMNVVCDGGRRRGELPGRSIYMYRCYVRVIVTS